MCTLCSDILVQLTPGAIVVHNHFHSFRKHCVIAAIVFSVTVQSVLQQLLAVRPANRHKTH